MFLATRRLECASRWAASPATMDSPTASMDIRYNIENTTHSFVTIETLDLWSNLTNDDNTETVDLWKIPNILIMILQKRSTYGESL